MNQANPALNTRSGQQIDARRPLMIIALLWGGAIAILLTTQTANAELRCDCAEVIDTCSASVSLEAMQVNIESDSRACSRVDYLIEGQPFAALVVGGSTKINWSGQPMRNPRVVVENCRVCAETGASSGPTKSNAEGTATPAAKTDGPAEAIVKIMPLYPRDAWTNDIEGDVTIEFNVSADGRVEQIKVVIVRPGHIQSQHTREAVVDIGRMANHLIAVGEIAVVDANPEIGLIRIVGRNN